MPDFLDQILLCCIVKFILGYINNTDKDDDMSGLLCCGGTLLFSGFHAALNAAGGAIGWSVLRSAGWKGVEFAYDNMVKATALGGFLLSLPVSCCVSTAAVAMKDPTILLSGFGWSVVSGALNSMLGSVILGYLNTGEQVGFAAAAGATGLGILGGAALVCFCVGACCYVVAQSSSGEPVAIKIPKANFSEKNGELQISEKGIQIVPLHQVISDAPKDMAGVSEFISEKTGLIIRNPDGIVLPNNAVSADDLIDINLDDAQRSKAYKP